MIYKIFINCVDGETFYQCGGSAKTVLEFLQRYDHEGSSTMLEIWSSCPVDPIVLERIEDDEKLWAKLQEAAKQ